MENYEDTKVYKRGLAYKKFGEALMNPKSTVTDLVTLAFDAELELSLAIGRRGETLPPPPATPAQIEAARQRYASGTDDICIDDDTVVSVVEDEPVVWVQAWVLVPKEETE